MLHPCNVQYIKNQDLNLVYSLVSPQALVNKANLYAPAAYINVLLAPAVMNKNNLQASCLSINILAKKTLQPAYFKDVTKPAAVLFCKHRAKDRDTLIEQSFICVYQQINGSAI